MILSLAWVFFLRQILCHYYVRLEEWFSFLPSVWWVTSEYSWVPPPKITRGMKNKHESQKKKNFGGGPSGWTNAIGLSARCQALSEAWSVQGWERPSLSLWHAVCSVRGASVNIRGPRHAFHSLSSSGPRVTHSLQQCGLGFPSPDSLGSSTPVPSLQVAHCSPLGHPCQGLSKEWLVCISMGRRTGNPHPPCWVPQVPSCLCLQKTPQITLWRKTEDTRDLQEWLFKSVRALGEKCMLDISG